MTGNFPRILDTSLQIESAHWVNCTTHEPHQCITAKFQSRAQKGTLEFPKGQNK